MCLYDESTAHCLIYVRTYVCTTYVCLYYLTYSSTRARAPYELWAVGCQLRLPALAPIAVEICRMTDDITYANTLLIYCSLQRTYLSSTIVSESFVPCTCSKALLREANTDIHVG